MAKRRVSKQQQRRIADIQQAKQHASGDEQEGLLLTCYGVAAVVEDQTGVIHRCRLRQHLGALVPGDKVIWQVSEQGDAVVVARLPRRTVIGRPDARGAIRALAANIDQVVIVVAPEPTLIPSLLDSYLVMAEAWDITPLLLFNKIDLLTSKQQQEAEQFFAYYQAIDYNICYTSSEKRHGLDALYAHLQHKANILVGQSGVGKSALIAALLPEEAIRVGALSSYRRQGMHTTTVARLYHLPEGGDLIDSPGIRELGLWHMAATDIAHGFREFRPYVGQCKYRNCLHQHEPDCAVLRAVQQGLISTERLSSYHLFLTKGAT